MVEKSILRWVSTGQIAIIILGYEGVLTMIEKRRLAGLRTPRL